MSFWGNTAHIEELKGKVITKITGLVKDNDEVHIYTADGNHYKMWHDQNCCESVTIDDVNGDVNDLLGSPILVAEMRTSGENPADFTDTEYQDSFTWTFYTFATKKGYVDFRWYGSSNGYYSEEVDFDLVTD